MASFRQEAETTIRFALVGVVNTIIGAGIMFGLYNLAGCGYWISSAANYFFGSISSYILNKKFTFRHSGDVTGSLIRFVICIAGSYFIAYGIAKPLMTFMLQGCTVKVRENMALVTGMVIFTVLNYTGQRLFAFRSKDSSPEKRTIDETGRKNSEE